MSNQRSFSFFFSDNAAKASRVKRGVRRAANALRPSVSITPVSSNVGNHDSGMDPNFGQTNSENRSKTIRMPYMSSDAKDDQARKTSPAHINNPPPSRVVPGNADNVDIEAGTGATENDESPVSGGGDEAPAAVDGATAGVFVNVVVDIESGRRTPPPEYIL